MQRSLTESKRLRWHSVRVHEHTCTYYIQWHLSTLGWAVKQFTGKSDSHPVCAHTLCYLTLISVLADHTYICVQRCIAFESRCCLQFSQAQIRFCYAEKPLQHGKSRDKADLHTYQRLYTYIYYTYIHEKVEIARWILLLRLLKSHITLPLNFLSPGNHLYYLLLLSVTLSQFIFHAIAP